MSEERSQFLLVMYEQMFANINRHIMVTWEVVPAVGGSLGAIALSESEAVSIQMGGSIVVLLGAWWIAHSLDANEWVKRNLFIISNIERQFLHKDDLVKIHYYFEDPHKVETLRYFQIQIASAFVLLIGSCFWVVVHAIRDGRFPYVFLFVLLGSVGYLLWLKKRTDNRLDKFAKTSPGATLESEAVD